MTWQWWVLAGLVLAALGLTLALVHLRARTSHDLAATRAEAEALRERLDRIEHEPARPEPPAGRAEREYTITQVGDAHAPVTSGHPAPRPGTGGFADLLLRESVIRLGSLTHGVRRALAAETRNRIRFEMKREVKRARKQRRIDRRAAHRDWQARQRDGLTDDELRDSA
jgi:hypothetical protein